MTQTHHAEVRTIADVDHVLVIAHGDWTQDQWTAEAEKALGTTVTTDAWDYAMAEDGTEVWTFCKSGCSQEQIFECRKGARAHTDRTDG